MRLRSLVLFQRVSAPILTGWLREPVSNDSWDQHSLWSCKIRRCNLVLVLSVHQSFLNRVQTEPLNPRIFRYSTVLWTPMGIGWNSPKHRSICKVVRTFWLALERATEMTAF